ncbi:MAG: hypothetical protein ACYC61_11740 [Isosphaeraceae bacterium]
MPELSFKEWVEQKAKEADSRHAARLKEWLGAYKKLRTQLERWLKEDGGEKIQIVDFAVMHNERGLGPYHIDGFWIHIGDDSVKVTPMGRNVIARLNPPGGGELRAEGRVDITSGTTKYHLYRTIQDGEDAWYVVHEEQFRPGGKHPRPDTLLTRERLQEILMDLMS